MPAYDVALIGCGSFGAWTAWHLRRAGLRVLLVDAWGPGHSRSSSGGESRIIRMGYGADVIYTRMAMRSLAQWKELERRAGDVLFHPTGVLWLARAGDAYSAATQTSLAREHVAAAILSAEELVARYPQFRWRDEGVYAIFEPESGVLMARRAVNAVVRDAVKSGADYAVASATLSRDGTVRSASGDEIRAGQFVFACGPWLPKLFPDLLGTRIYPTRQEVLFFAPPPGDSRLQPAAFPAWIDFTDPRGPYGIPDLESRGVKVGFDLHGPPFDPDAGDRQVTADGVAMARRFLAERLPLLTHAPLTETRVCQYENTSNGDFLLDRHPDFPNVWLAGGGSGHGFKHGPAVGEYLCGRIVGGAPEEPRFSLASKSEEQQRTVY
jgi:sarcosine oxidase